MSAPLQLEVRQVDAGYGPIQALWDISLEVVEGEIVSLIGSNGAGKTTTLKVISGFMRPMSGDVVFSGSTLTNLTPSAIVQQGIAHVPEGRRVFGNLTVAENLKLGAYARGQDEEEETAALVCDLFPILAERARQPAGTLSGGEQQMLAIGRALMSKPRLLLLDEPSLGIMPKLVTRLFEAILELRSYTTILLVEQNVPLALRVADRAYVLENGRIALEGTTQELANDARIKNAYLGITVPTDDTQHNSTSAPRSRPSEERSRKHAL